MIKKILACLAVTFCVGGLLTTPILADDEIRNLQVNLKAKGFSQSNWVDNLDSSNIIFAPNDQFQILIDVKNLGNRNQTQVQVGELLPPSLTVVDANGATFSGNKLTYTIPQVAANQDNTKTIIVAVKDKTKIKKDLFKNSTTVSIRSEVGSIANDNLYFYTSNGSLGNTVATTSGQTLPKTGANPLVTGTAVGSSLITLSFVLRKLARGY